MNTVVSAFRTHLITVAIWAAVILAVLGLVLWNRSQQAALVASLSSPNPATRAATVRDLIQSGRLVDVLTGTEDPNSESTSPQNVTSAALRESAAATAAQLAAAGKVATGPAMSTLFLLCKDSDATVKASAESGLQALAETSDADLGAVVQRLKDGDPDIRGAAVDVLGLVAAAPGEGDKVARRVNAVLMDPASQDAAESALGKAGSAAVPYVTARLDAPGATVDFRRGLIDVLGTIGTTDTLTPLMEQARSDQPSLRREAVVTLAAMVLNDAAALQKAQVDPKAKPGAAQKAAATLAMTRPALPILVAALRNTGLDSQTRSQSALALGALGGSQAQASLIASLGDYDNSVRQAAISGLQSLGGPAVGPLLAALTQGSVETRAAAAEALGGIGSPAAIAALGQALSDPLTPVAVRLGAAVGLGRSGAVAAVPTLVKALGDPNGQVQAAASQALLAPQLSAPAVAPLIASFAQPTPVPFNAAQTLSRMGDQAVPALEAAARSSRPQTQTWAAVTLGETDSKDPGVSSTLHTLADSKDSEVQYAASQAIDRLAGA